MNPSDPDNKTKFLAAERLSVERVAFFWTEKGIGSAMILESATT